MKKGFFSLLVLLFASNLAFANVNTSEYPQGDVEDFWDRIKAACEDPDSAGNQLPPSNILIKCEDVNYTWVPGKNGDSVNLPQSGEMTVSIFCDKDLGELTEDFSYELPPIKVPCPRYIQMKNYTSITVQGVTCEEIKDVDSVVEWCKEKLMDGDSESKPTGLYVDFCPKGPGQKPPGPVPHEVPAKYTPNLNYWVK
ncbi:MAG: hypothetical protein DRQ88_04765 [Epsilonproteobacteria bacterium]|nr:MAG: hypothetical protein DRQ88_04765 [Campylobacterota bacterium]